MEHTLNNEFEAKVKTLVEGLGYSLLDGEFFSADFYTLEKKAYIKTVAELNKIYKKRTSKTLPSAVVTFPSSENLKNIAIVLFDKTQEDCGVVKLVDASKFPLDNPSLIQNLVYHQASPGENNLKFYDISEDEWDYVEDHWNEYVQIVSYTALKNNCYSWFLSDYHSVLPIKEGYTRKELEFSVTSGHGSLLPILENHLLPPHKVGFYKGKVIRKEELKSSRFDYKLIATDIPSDREYEGEYYEIKDKEVVVVSLLGELCPTVIDPKDDVVCVPLSEMAVIDTMGLDAEYLVMELQKDYVTKQIEEKLREVMDNKSYVLELIQIYVPLESNGQSSIEKQKKLVQAKHESDLKFLEKELRKARTVFLKEYKEVCEYCQEECLLDLLTKLKNDEISDYAAIFNSIRQLVEWVKLESPAHLSQYKDEKDLSEWSKKLSHDPNIPEYIKRSLHTCVRLGHEGSHRDKDKEKQWKNLLDQAPYLAKSLMYCILNILYWCKDLDNKDNNV